MQAIESPIRPATTPGRRERGAHVYHRAPAPVFFPEAEEVPETNRHLELRTALYLILKRELASVATLGSDQFVYWDPTTSKKRLAPDAFVRLGAPHRTFRSWKIWERGAPDLGVEIVSDSDEGETDWNEKLERYQAAGISEVVRFHPEDQERPIRIWDAVDGDLVERAPGDPDLHACEALGLWWLVVEDRALGPMLRLARDREGHDLLPTPDEAEAKEREAKVKEREAKVKAREGEARAREGEARAQEANKLLQGELEALRAELKKAKGTPRKRAPR
jgi:Uma2 family endonuclease